MLGLDDQRFKFWREHIDDKGIEETRAWRDGALATHDDKNDGRGGCAGVIEVVALQEGGIACGEMIDALLEVERHCRDARRRRQEGGAKHDWVSDLSRPHHQMAHVRSTWSDKRTQSHNHEFPHTTTRHGRGDSTAARCPARGVVRGCAMGMGHGQLPPVNFEPAPALALPCVSSDSARFVFT